MHCCGDDGIKLGCSHYRLGLCDLHAGRSGADHRRHRDAPDQLLYSNLFLGLVDLTGVWRWLGRRARISDTARAEEQRSDDRAGESLFSTAKFDGLPVKSRDGEVLAGSVAALAACVGGRIDFFIIRAGGVGGVGEPLYRLPWSEARVGAGEISTSFDRSDLSRLAIATGG